MRVNYRPVWLCNDDNDRRDESRPSRYINKAVVYSVIAVIVTATFYFGGIFTTVTEDRFEGFTYPLEISNFRALIQEVDRYRGDQKIPELNHTKFVEILKNIKVDGLDTRAIVPYNQFSEFKFDIDVGKECLKYWLQPNIKESSEESQKLKVVIVIKSAVNYHTKRDAIRDSWRLNGPFGLFNFRTVFIVGSCHENNPIPKTLRSSLNGTGWTPQMCHDYISKEASTYGDIIQSSGVDSYYNNTIKTIMTHKWLTERCQSDFILTIDDDYALEVENLINYLENLAVENYNDTLNLPDVSSASFSNYPSEKKFLALKKLSQQYLYAGYLRNFVHPHRHFISKFYISKRDYSFNKYPPFITGGLILMSQKFSRHLYLSSYLVRSFKFDDVYLGIIAYKLGAKAVHEENTMCVQEDYINSKPHEPNSTNCIAVHEVAPQDLVAIWKFKTSKHNHQPAS